MSLSRRIRERCTVPLRLVVLVICVSGIAGCKDIPASPSAAGGTYAYQAFDTAGVEIVRGRLVLDMSDSSHVTGSWQLEIIGNAANTGLQSGNGLLEGDFEYGRLFLDLNPGFRDNNIFLSGTVNGGRFSGTWEWSGIAGPINHGSFEALRR